MLFLYALHYGFGHCDSGDLFFYRAVWAKVFTYMGSSGFRFGVLIPSLLVTVILVCYYGVTFYIIKKNLAATLDLEHGRNSQ